jgi:hypothetical protein
MKFMVGISARKATGKAYPPLKRPSEKELICKRRRYAESPKHDPGWYHGYV